MSKLRKMLSQLLRTEYTWNVQENKVQLKILWPRSWKQSMIKNFFMVTFEICRNPGYQLQHILLQYCIEGLPISSEVPQTMLTSMVIEITNINCFSKNKKFFKWLSHSQTCSKLYLHILSSSVIWSCLITVRFGRRLSYCLQASLPTIKVYIIVIIYFVSWRFKSVRNARLDTKVEPLGLGDSFSFDFHEPPFLWKQQTFCEHLLNWAASHQYCKTSFHILWLDKKEINCLWLSALVHIKLTVLKLYP